MTASKHSTVDGRTLERSAIPVDLDGGESGHLWVYQDVTERTRYERRLDALHETSHPPRYVIGRSPNSDGRPGITLRSTSRPG